MLRVAVIDDEPRSLGDLSRRLEATGLFTVILRETDPLRALDTLHGEKPDLVVLDIEMPGLDGIALASALPPGVAVVFVSAHSGYALAAFDVPATDYLLKPVDDARFARMIERVRQRLAALDDRERDRVGDTAEDRGLLLIPTLRGKVMCPSAEILVVFAEGDMSRIHLRGDRQIVCRMGLKRLARLLPASGYLRIDRSTILNLAAVRALRALPGAKVEVVLADSMVPLEMGRAAGGRLRQALAESSFQPQGQPDP